MKARIAMLSAWFAASFCGIGAAQPLYDEQSAAAARAQFIDDMIDQHGFSRAELDPLIGSAAILPSVLEAISRPAERVVPWYDYRGIFLTATRISGGAQFWQQHAARLELVSTQTGVAPEVIVAIIGVETFFGQRMGTYRVVDALATLAFAYPPRSAFFTSELEHFLLLNREEGFSLEEVLGSYAGAMGAGQFIPSSYRAYAVDGDGDDRRDLWGNWGDIIASVANYLSVHGWQASADVIVPAARAAEFTGSEPDNRLELDSSVSELRAAGYRFQTAAAETDRAAVFSFEQDPDALEYWVGLDNFYVITRYNRSTKYALAVWQLAEAIREEYRSSNEQG